MIGAPAIVALNNARSDTSGTVAAFGLGGLALALVVIAAVEIRRRRKNRDTNRDTNSKIGRLPQ
jgi:hypothetical protein